MKKVGVIGIGTMGHGIADNFIKNGYDVVVWNRSQDKTADLIKKGAAFADNPKQATQYADIIFEVTANDESSREVWEGEQGILEDASSDKFLITCATLSADRVNEMAQVAQQKNLKFFDMPMTGGRMGAVNGQLILLASGDRDQIDEIKDVLKAIAKDVKYFGAVGSGTKYKLILNSLQAVHAAGFGEAMKMAKEVGLDEKLVGEALAELPGGYTTQMSWNCYQHAPEPINFSIDWLTKDLDYAHKMIKGNYDLMDVAQAKYDQAKELGHGKEDWTIVNKLESGGIIKVKRRREYGQPRQD